MLFADFALNDFYWYFSIKKIKVSVSASIGENFKVLIPIPWKMADTTDTIVPILSVHL